MNIIKEEIKIEIYTKLQQYGTSMIRDYKWGTDLDRTLDDHSLCFCRLRQDDFLSDASGVYTCHHTLEGWLRQHNQTVQKEEGEHHPALCPVRRAEILRNTVQQAAAGEADEHAHKARTAWTPIQQWEMLYRIIWDC